MIGQSGVEGDSPAKASTTSQSTAVASRASGSWGCRSISPAIWIDTGWKPASIHERIVSNCGAARPAAAKSLPSCRGGIDVNRSGGMAE